MNPPLNIYDLGFTPFFAARVDPRFCYCLFVPPQYRADAEKRLRLLVLIHGTERGAWKYRERFAEFAEQHDCVILAPLFPCNTFGDYDLENYKFIESHGVRYDRVLLCMIDEVRERYRLDADRFLMFGFSGGGHFAHRFYYLHPERLRAVSIGAPGIVTMLDDHFDFWVGTRDWERRFGKAIDVESMRAVAVQTVIGSADRETWEIEVDRGDPLWMPGADLTATLDRHGRINLLRASFERHGISVAHVVVPDAGHECKPLVPAVQDFFRTLIAGDRDLAAAGST